MVRGLFVGLTTLDVIQTVMDPVGPNEKVTALTSDIAVGGPAAVAAIAFAALGGHARLVTAIGSGPAAQAALLDLASTGVEIVDLAPDGFGLAPSTAIVVASTGERSVVSGSGHRPRLTDPGTLVDGEDVIVVDGHHPVLAAAAVRQAGDIPVVVDAGSHKPVFDEILPLATDVICSADYVHPHGLSPQDLQRLGPRLVAVSHGADPIEWWTSDDAGTVPVPPVTPVDSLGAGDVLHGAYAWSLATTGDRLASLEFGASAASQRVGIAGVRAWRGLLLGGA